VLAGKVDAPFGFDDLVMQERLLTGIKESKGAAGKRIVMPHIRSADLKFLQNLGVDGSHVLYGLLDAFVRGQRTPALSIFRPGITGK